MSSIETHPLRFPQEPPSPFGRSSRRRSGDDDNRTASLPGLAPRPDPGSRARSEGFREGGSRRDWDPDSSALQARFRPLETTGRHARKDVADPPDASLPKKITQGGGGIQIQAAKEIPGGADSKGKKAVGKRLDSGGEDRSVQTRKQRPE